MTRIEEKGKKETNEKEMKFNITKKKIKKILNKSKRVAIL